MALISERAGILTARKFWRCGLVDFALHMSFSSAKIGKEGARCKCIDCRDYGNDICRNKGSTSRSGGSGRDYNCVGRLPGNISAVK